MRFTDRHGKSIMIRRKLLDLVSFRMKCMRIVNRSIHLSVGGLVVDIYLATRKKLIFIKCLTSVNAFLVF